MTLEDVLDRKTAAKIRLLGLDSVFPFPYTVEEWRNGRGSNNKYQLCSADREAGSKRQIGPLIWKEPDFRMDPTGGLCSLQDKHAGPHVMHNSNIGDGTKEFIFVITGKAYIEAETEDEAREILADSSLDELVDIELVETREI